MLEIEQTDGARFRSSSATTLRSYNIYLVSMYIGAALPLDPAHVTPVLAAVRGGVHQSLAARRRSATPLPQLAHSLQDVDSDTQTHHLQKTHLEMQCECLRLTCTAAMVASMVTQVILLERNHDSRLVAQGSCFILLVATAASSSSSSLGDGTQLYRRKDGHNCTDGKTDITVQTDRKNTSDRRTFRYS